MHFSSIFRCCLSGGIAVVAAGLLADSSHACLNTNTLEPCQCIEKMLMAGAGGGPQVATPSLSGRSASPASSRVVPSTATSYDLFVGDTISGFNYYSHDSGQSSQMGNLTVAVGDTITWIMDQGSRRAHTISTLPNAPVQFDSGFLFSVGDSFSYTFTTPGEYGYYCENHASYNNIGGVIVTSGTQVGTITVVAAPEPGAISILGIAALVGLVQRRRKMTK